MTALQMGADEVERRFLEGEHREIARGAGRLSEIAALVGTVSAGELASSLYALVQWLNRSFEPHAAWEEAWFYPALSERLGTTWPARLMRFEHDQIRRDIERVDADRALLRHEISHEAVLDVRSHLYGLEALIRAHVEREDRFLLPLLDESAEPRPSAATA
jgi:hemerythrin-like domain-containing protein